MSTRQSVYYDGPIHIWFELMDGRYYVSFNEDGLGNRYPVWGWIAHGLASVLRRTDRVARHEAECERQRLEYLRTKPERDAERDRLMKIFGDKMP